jgi:DNA-binding XRE family transcriptional regulator
MPRRKLPRIASVKAGRKALTLIIVWQDGGTSAVDVSGIAGTFKVYAPLRRSDRLFRTVRTGEYGSDIVWDGGIDMSADTLWRLAQEQSGAVMTHMAFKAWRERQAYTLDAAARALGLSRRMVAYYENGEKPVPRVVALATKALSAEGAHTAA